MLREAGILPDDPRIAETVANLERVLPALSQAEPLLLTVAEFATATQRNRGIIERAVLGELAIPDFPALVGDLHRIHREVGTDRSGAVAEYIPQLARVDPDQFAISVCTVDGQRFSIGDADVNFCLQSVSKTVSYCLTLEEHGPDTVHRHMGREPSGQGFNELTFNKSGLPHNPMINAGAIMSCALIQRGLDAADRFDFVAETWKRLAGGRSVGFNNSVYLSERNSADRNFALGYSMRERGAFPPGTDLLATLEFYIQCCSIEVNAQQLAIAAASLANAERVPADGGPRLLRPDRAPLPVADVLVRHVRLLRRVRLHHRSARQERGLRRPDAGRAPADGHRHLVAPAGRPWEFGAGDRGLPTPGRLLQRAHVRPAHRHRCRDRQARPPASSVTRVPPKASWDCASPPAAATSTKSADWPPATFPSTPPITTAVPPCTWPRPRATGTPWSSSLSRGVDPMPVDRWGGTPLDDANRSGHRQLAQLLADAAAQGQ
ncbi:hypothetical protein GCM10020000_77880 [Streptomyces olivoverticillatus]